jgi:acetyl esterase/lipase
MKRKTIFGLSLGLISALFLTGCQVAKEESAGAEGVASFSNQSDLDIVEKLPTTLPDARILYDENPLTYGDIRLPADAGDGDGKYPLVVLLHGGAWESSYTLEYMGQLAESLTNAGVATWNLEYRRLNNPGGGYPGTFLDVANGIDHVVQLAEDYPIDLDRVVLMGHSSGGHLATWAAGRKSIPKDSEFYTENPLRVSGVIDLAGVLDLEYAYQAGRDDIMHILDAADDKELSAKAPTASSINLLPMGVPQTLIIGSEDNPWRLESQERYRATGNDGGDVIDLVTLDGANHFDVVDPCSPAWTPIVSAVFKYVDEPLNEAVLAPSANVCATRATPSQ